MIAIRFSHTYAKMPADTSDTQLLAVFRVDRTQLSDPFLEWDTRIVGGGHYQFPPADEYLVLLLLSGGQLWTTVRTAKPGKEEYYRAQVGKHVKIKVGHGGGYK